MRKTPRHQPHSLNVAIRRNFAHLAAPALLIACSGDPKDSAAEAANIVTLSATLTPPNQTGTDPAYFSDDLGVVPSTATGTFRATLNLDSRALEGISVEVSGMAVADLRDFGPNETPFHIHLPGEGVQGAFGPNVLDLSYGMPDGSIVDTADGFSFVRDELSILGDAQGGFVDAGVFPGDDVIADQLQNGHAFLLVHSMKDIFTSTGLTLPNGDPAPDGFPFGELRGEIIAE